MLTTPLLNSCTDEWIQKTEDGFIKQEISKGKNNCTNRFLKEFDSAHMFYIIKGDTNLLVKDKTSYVSKLISYSFGMSSPEWQSNQLGWLVEKNDSILFTADSLHLVHYITDNGKHDCKKIVSYSCEELSEGIEIQTELWSNKYAHFARLKDKKFGKDVSSKIKVEHEIPIFEIVRKGHFYYGGKEYVNDEGDTIQIKALKDHFIYIKKIDSIQ